jgi:hypothetical protein
MPILDATPDELQLHALLDGELNDAEQQAMFARLSADHDLQRRYRELLQLRAAMHEDARSLTVPPEVTAAVFTAVGLSIPETISAATAASTHTAATAVPSAPIAVAARAGWWTVRRLALLLAGGGALVVGGLLLRPTAADAPATATAPRHESIARTAPPSSTGDAAAAQQAAPLHRAATVPAAASAAQRAQRQFPARRDAADRGTRGTQGTSAVEAARPVPAPVDAPARDAAAPAGRELDPSPARTDTQAAPARPPATAEDAPVAAVVAQRAEVGPARAGQPLGVLVTLRALAAASSPAVDVASQSGSDLRDVVIGAGYAATEDDRIGLEIGREAFPQTFTRVEGAVTARYAQKPVETWFAAFYERALWRMFQEKMILFSKIDAGAVMELGPLARAGIGLRAALGPMVEVHVAGEGAIAAYRFESQWLSSRRYGLTAGLTVVF